MSRQRAFWTLAAPNVLANLSIPLASLIDAALLGRLDRIEPLAGVALAGLIFDYAYWGFGFLRMGVTGLTARAYGAGDVAASAGVFYRSLLLAMVFGSLMAASSGLIGDLGFWLLQGGPEVEAEGRAYFEARIWGAPAALGGYVTIGWLLGRQRAKAALWITLVLNGVNIALDWLFIFKLGWGSRGAGLATMIAECSAFALGLWLVRLHWRGHPRFRLTFWRDRAAFGALLRLQADLMLRTFCLITAFSLFTNLSAMFGAVTLAANAVLLRLLNAAAFFIDGYAFALESLAGHSAGAGDESGVRRALRTALEWNVVTAAVFILGFVTAGRSLIGVIIANPAAVDAAVARLPYVCVALALSGFAYIYDGLFIGLTRGKLLRQSMLAALILGFLPFAAAAWRLKQPDWLWWGMISFMAWRAVTLAWRAHRGSLSET